MSYEAQAKLAQDPTFQNRVAACCVEQADTFRSDTNSSNVRLADAVIRGAGPHMTSFYSLVAATPGFSDNADRPDGSIDSNRIPDSEIKTAVIEEWPVVAEVFYPA